MSGTLVFNNNHLKHNFVSIGVVDTVENQTGKNSALMEMLGM